MTGKVYVAQEPHPRRLLDLSTAEVYGEVVHVFDFAHGTSLRPADSYGAAATALDSFDPSKDFVLACGGDQMSLGVVIHILAYEHELANINFLRWDRITQAYQPSFIGVERPS